MINPEQNFSTSKRWAILISFVVSIILWFAWFGSYPSIFLTLGITGPIGLLVLVGLLIAWVSIPTARIRSAKLLDTIKTRLSRYKQLSAIVVAIIATIYLLHTGISEHRDRFPILHDEYSYLIGAHQLAIGKLWVPAHPLAHFFDSFQLIVDPVYASAYFPGTALVFAFAIITHIPTWLFGVILSGIVVGHFYLLISEWLDPVAGILGALLLPATGLFRTLSFMVMAQIPVLLAGLTLLLAFTYSSRSSRKRWAILLGASAGLLMITRPVDGICYVFPVSFALLIQIRKPKTVQTIALAIFAASPFLLLQLLSNHGITGDWLQTPFRLYADRDHPLTSFGFHSFDPAARPVSDLPQKQTLYFNDYLPQIAAHTPANFFPQQWRDRLPKTLTFSTPFPFPVLLPLLLIGFAAGRPRDWLLLGTIPLFVLLYAFYVFFLPYYPLAVVPAVIFAILLGSRAVPAFFPNHQRRLEIFFCLFIAGVGIASLPQFDSTANDQMRNSPLLQNVQDSLSHLTSGRAIALFRYDPARDVNEEPVYNAGVPFPDDARIVRAHDRGLENIELFRYFAKIQPDRTVYIYDEKSRTITRLGNVATLASVSK